MRKIKQGDVFYMPVDDNMRFIQKPNGSDGKYIVNPEDQVCFGQVVFTDGLSTTVAIFDILTLQKNITSYLLEEIVKADVIIINSVISSGLNRGWWQ